MIRGKGGRWSSPGGGRSRPTAAFPWFTSISRRIRGASRKRRWLDGGERERCTRFLVQRPRREFRLCRAALRALLCRRLGCRNDALAFAPAEHGKPFALVDGAPAPVSFNVSHSGCHGLIAVAAGGRIGVDIEERVIRHDIDGVLRTAFAPDEQADLAAASGRRKTELLFRLWTMKEALIKALGSGLSLDTASFTLPAGLRRGAVRSALFRFPWMPGVEWVLSDLSNAGFAAALAHDGAAERPT